MDNSLMSTCDWCPFSAQRSHFSWSTHWKGYRATLLPSWWSSSWPHAGEDCTAQRLHFNPSKCCSIRKYVAGERSHQYLCKSSLGHQEIACKKYAVAFGSKNCMLFVDIDIALLQSMGKIYCWWRDLEDGERLLACSHWSYLKYVPSYCKAGKILRGFLCLQPQLSRLNIT